MFTGEELVFPGYESPLSEVVISDGSDEFPPPSAYFLLWTLKRGQDDCLINN